MIKKYVGEEYLANLRKMAKEYDMPSLYLEDAAGWDDWMYEFLDDIGLPSSEDMNDPSFELDDRQIKAINNLLLEVWNEEHGH